MAEYFWPCDVRERQAELLAHLEQEIGMKISSAVSLGLSVGREPIDEDGDTTSDVPTSLLVNSEVEIEQFAALMQRLTRTEADPNVLPFLQGTIPALINACAKCRVDVECLLPYYLKPYLQATKNRPYQGSSTFQTPVIIEFVKRWRARRFSFQWLRYPSQFIHGTSTEQTRNHDAETLFNGGNSTEKHATTRSVEEEIKSVNVEKVPGAEDPSKGHSISAANEKSHVSTVSFMCLR
ncbi:hypothetical protein KIN20_011345 [Parelaphostrongylus tenuis]|uniref:TAFH domain-containing protein n=1 Tax=Parelaphostrongylus tenuis TaxID=148309 RepID=A0AAD5QME7_PARTN|nr:hypothetical protein KIN20_011345 [Parelaphostrongylus tenuis]